MNGLRAEQEETVPAFLEEPVTPTIPLFYPETGKVWNRRHKIRHRMGQEAESKAEQKIKSNTANRGALRGTAVHRVMECSDFASEKSVQEQMEAMEKRGEDHCGYARTCERADCGGFCFLGNRKADGSRTAHGSALS